MRYALVVYTGDDAHKTKSKLTLLGLRIQAAPVLTVLVLFLIGGNGQQRKRVGLKALTAR